MHREARSEYKHCRRVKWLSSHRVELPEALTLGTKTLTDVTAYEDLVAFVRDQYFESHVRPNAARMFPNNGRGINNVSRACSIE